MIDPYLAELTIKRHMLKVIVGLIILFLMTQIGACSPTIRAPILWVKRPIVWLLGKPNTNPMMPLYSDEVYADYTDPQAGKIYHWKGYEVQNTFLKTYRVRGTVGYLDINDSLLKGWYLTAGDDYSAQYKKIAPYDLCLVFGAAARPEVMKYLDIKHEENACWIRNSSNVEVDYDDISNFHIIVPKASIRQVLSILKHGDDVQIEGLLAHWHGTGSLARNEFRSALYRGELYPRLAGGRPGAGLCKQIYITRLIWNGRVYE